MTDLLPAHVMASLAEILGTSTGGNAGHPQVVHAGEGYWVLLCRHCNEDVVVKLAAKTSVAPSFEAASAKHTLIQRLVGVPMATMIAADDTCSRIPLRYSIQSRLKGRTWFATRGGLGEHESRLVLTDLGEIVGRLHQPILPSFGDLTDPKEPNCAVALETHATKIIANPKLRDQFLRLLSASSGLWAGLKAGITHDDLHGFNILLKTGGTPRVSGVLDFDKAWSGPVESDLARMELWQGMTSPAFLRAYRRLVPELPGYADRQPFYQLLWCLEFAQNTLEHLATTNQLAARLGMPRVERFT